MELIRTEISDVSADVKRITGFVRYNDGNIDEYWYEYPSHFEISDTGNPWLAALLPMAATINEDLIISLPLDQRLIDGAENILRFWNAYDVGTSIISIIPSGGVCVLDNSPKDSAAFFSSGVDAFYTAYNKPRAKYQILIHGFDLSIDKRAEFERHLTRISKISKQMGKELVSVRTNIRQTQWKKTRWQVVSHGAALASIGLLFEKYFREIFIPSSLKNFRDTYCWGSHPVTDPLFSTSKSNIITDGDGLSRYEKVQFISNHQLALDNLHVCIRGRDGSGQDEINCSHCEKCYRTMIALDLIGVLEKAKLFDLSKYNYDEISMIFPSNESTTGNYEKFIKIAEEKNRPEIANNIRKCIKRSKLINLLSPLDKVPLLWRIPYKMMNNSID
ncbi:MAG: hypothetical protein KDF58_01470 [Alphaproteobacteria bacterium]|nr:hypothetical protein [Alphaproteobacteria bacterium]HPF46183.1 hypothetical protein [Emcibacteraceae bacterium]